MMTFLADQQLPFLAAPIFTKFLATLHTHSPFYASSNKFQTQNCAECDRTMYTAADIPAVY